MNPQWIFEQVMELSILPFFPSEPAARLAIARMIGNMANNEIQVEWLVSVMTSGAFQKWEGPAELRAVFVQKFCPKDGIVATVSSVYPDGMSREQLNPGRKVRELGSPAALQLESGRTVSNDAELDSMVAELVPAKDLNRIRSYPVAVVPVGRDETEYAVLQRTVVEARTEYRKSILRPASAAEIADVKARQMAAAGPETRRILEEEASYEQAQKEA